MESASAFKTHDPEQDQRCKALEKALRMQDVSRSVEVPRLSTLSAHLYSVPRVRLPQALIHASSTRHFFGLRGSRKFSEASEIPGSPMEGSGPY